MSDIPPRRALSKRTRFAIFKRDEFTCQYCGRKPPNVVLEVDHIQPVAGGGGDNENNVLTACFDCNRGKGAIAIDIAPMAISVAADLARERVLQMAAMAQAFNDERDQIEEFCWDVAELLKPGAANGFNVSHFASIKRFVEELGYAQTMQAAEIAARAKHPGGLRFKYFCGVCWKKIRENKQ